MSRAERITDELLVLRCQEGDAAAFQELVGRWQERLWRHAWRLTGHQDAAWDVVQEAWIGITRGLSRLEDPGAFPAWAFGITSHKCRDWIRRERRRRQAAEVYAEDVRQGTRETSGTSEQRLTLRDALRRLSGRDRAILSLRYQEGFEVSEIAEILRIPPGTVKSRLYYARQRLRHYLEETSDE